MSDRAITDADLAHRVLTGDRRAESELVVRFQKRVRQITVGVAGNASLAEELSQETFVVTLRRLRSVPLEDPTKLPAFIVQTARNLAIAEKRKERRRRTDNGGRGIEELADSAVDENRRAEADVIAAAVRAVLTKLSSERDRQVLIRHYLQDEDRDVICRDLGVREAAFNVILFRARRRLLEKLTQRGIGPTDLVF